jgi:hypothetical protein
VAQPESIIAKATQSGFRQRSAGLVTVSLGVTVSRRNSGEEFVTARGHKYIELHGCSTTFHYVHLTCSGNNRLTNAVPIIEPIPLVDSEYFFIQGDASITTGTAANLVIANWSNLLYLPVPSDAVDCRPWASKNGPSLMARKYGVSNIDEAFMRFGQVVS